jgi:hypothetical protein
LAGEKFLHPVGARTIISHNKLFGKHPVGVYRKNISDDDLLCEAAAATKQNYRVERKTTKVKNCRYMIKSKILHHELLRKLTDNRKKRKPRDGCW